MKMQIHKLDDGTIKIFSRNSEDQTQKYPDLIATLKEVCNQRVGGMIVGDSFNRKELCIGQRVCGMGQKRREDVVLPDPLYKRKESI